jgi:3-oxoacyl-[acyl-carrier protein] reductase
MTETNELVALVTGSTAGIGKAIALHLAQEGYRIILNGRREQDAIAPLIREIEAANGHAGSTRYIRGDIGEQSTRSALANGIEGGALDVLVNNAAVSTRGRKDILELSEEELAHLLRINLIAPFLLTTTLIPFMQSNDRLRYIINISSISAYTASVTRADYCISKAGLSMMTQLFALRLAQENIRVFEMRPGIIETDMTKPVKEKYDKLILGGLLPIARWGTPEDVARAVIGIVRGYHPYSTGSVINIDGGFHLRSL